MSALLFIFAGHVVGFFGLSGDSLEIGISIVRFLAMFFWIFAAYQTFNGLLQGAGDTLLVSSATLSALVIRVILGYSAVHLGLLGPEAAWISTPIGWAVAICISGTRYFTGGWKKKAVAGKFKRT